MDSIVVSISTDNKLVVEGVENRQDFSFNFVSSVPLPKNIDPESITKHQFGPILTIRGRVFAPTQFLIENSNNEFISIVCNFAENIDESKLTIEIDDDLIVSYKSWSKKVKLPDNIDRTQIKYSVDKNRIEIIASKFKATKPKIFLCGGPNTC